MSRKTSRVLGVAAWLAVVVTACGSRIYGYAPVTTTGAEIVGHPTAELPFPPDSPQGNVRLATLGLAQATAESGRSIHVRMVATNRGADSWVIRESEQELAIAVGDGARTTIVRAKADPRATQDRVAVPPGGTAMVDLYFPLPPGAQGASDVPAFDALWSVHIGPRAITTRTPFERFLVSSPAQNVPAASYPYSTGTRREPPPTTPDPRWPSNDPTLMPDVVPRPPAP